MMCLNFPQMLMQQHLNDVPYWNLLDSLDMFLMQLVISEINFVIDINFVCGRAVLAHYYDVGTQNA
jgi:hypothetical protein